MTNNMIEHIKNLEKKTNKERTDYVKQTLKQINVTFSVQPFRQRILRGENIIVEQFCGDSPRQLLLTAHTNKYFSSPGANDNASGVAVLLGIISHLKKRNLKKTIGIKVVFFDHEDGLAILDGSSFFVSHTDITNISFVLNLDGVGIGNSFTLSPRITRKNSNHYVSNILQFLNHKNIRYFSFDLPPLMIEDHMPFLQKNIRALSVNLMPEQDLEYLKDFAKKSWLQKLIEALFYRGSNRKNHPMVVMRHRHNELDTSEYIQEKSLELAFSLSIKMVDYHTRNAVAKYLDNVKEFRGV